MKNLLLVLGLAGLAVTVSANFCFVCSTATDPTCLVPADTLLMRDCTAIANNNTCFSRVVNRHLERGCSASLSREDFANCNSETSCELCHDAVNQGRCNGAIFPAHRLHCHQCSGEVNSTCGQEITTSAQLCRMYEPQDQCYVSVVGDLVERGCLSESDFCRVGQTCHTCDGNGCNFEHHDSAGLSLIVSLRTIGMALLAAMAYGSFRQ